jgi:hypothetical protein
MNTGMECGVPSDFTPIPCPKQTSQETKDLHRSLPASFQTDVKYIFLLLKKNQTDSQFFCMHCVLLKHRNL